MTDYFIDDSGDDSDGLSWATAWKSVKVMQDTGGKGTSGARLTSSDRVFFGADSNDPSTYAANSILYGPTSGAPCQLISSTVGTGTTVSYSVGTGTQWDSSDGAYYIKCDGRFAVYGLKFKTGSIYYWNSARQYFNGCTFVLPSSYAQVSRFTIFDNCTFDLASTSSSTAVIYAYQGYANFRNCTWTNAASRTGPFLTLSIQTTVEFSGCDLSGITGLSKLVNVESGVSGSTAVFTNCKTESSPVYINAPDADAAEGIQVLFSNCASADEPRQMVHMMEGGSTVAYTTVYRSTGATVEGLALGWLVVTSSSCTEQMPYKTPWIYGTISSTGNKALSIYISHDDGAPLQDDEIWIEAEYMDTSNSGLWTRVTNQRATTLTGAVDQTTDTSDWNGRSPTYKQVLTTPTISVDEDGQYRARVCVGKEMASTDYLYVDPKVTVS